MPVAKFSNTTNRTLRIRAEGDVRDLAPGSSLAGNFSDEEWAAAKAARNDAREAVKIRRRDLGIPDAEIAADEKVHNETVERDKAWVLWREENNAKAAKEIEGNGGRKGS